MNEPLTVTLQLKFYGYDGVINVEQYLLFQCDFGFCLNYDNEDDVSLSLLRAIFT